MGHRKTRELGLRGGGKALLIRDNFQPNSQFVFCVWESGGDFLTLLFALSLCHDETAAVAIIQTD